MGERHNKKREKMYKPAYEYDRFLIAIRNILGQWRHPNDWHSNNNVVENLMFGHFKFSLTRYWITGISKCGTNDSNMETAIPKIVGRNRRSLQNRMPKAWLDMTDKSNMFPRSSSHEIYNMYGLRAFIIIKIIGKKEMSYEMKNLLLDMFSFIALNYKCQLPLFVEYSSNPSNYSIPGVLGCPGCFIYFLNWICYNTSPNEFILNDIMEMINYELFQGKLQQGAIEDAKVSSLFTYCIHIEKSDYSRKKYQIDFTSEDHWFDKYECPDIKLYLYATWFDMLQSEVLSHEATSHLSLLEASKWSVKADVTDISASPLGECLKSALDLCSSFQSFMDCRKEELKVPSRLLEKDESNIPVKSLNVVLDFLFCDTKLQPSQHSSGSDPITKTTVEEVEDKFYLSYKEVSKYFKSAQLSSLTSRLAICMCIVNKYHGGLGAMNQLWAEFCKKLRYLAKNDLEIKGLEPVEPILDYPELIESLQRLNYAIKWKALSQNTDFTGNDNLKFEHISKVLEERQPIYLSWYISDQFVNRRSLIPKGQELRYPFEMRDDGLAKTQRWIGELRRRAKGVLRSINLLIPTEVMFRLMPILINSAVITLLKHPVSKIGSFQEELHEIKHKLILHLSKREFTFSLIEEQIHQLTIIEQKMAAPQYLWLKFRQIDSSNIFKDFELLELISDLVASREVPIETSIGELPSNTRLGQLIYGFFHDHEEEVDAKETNSETVVSKVKVDELLKPWLREYISILDCSETTRLCWRLHSFVFSDEMFTSVAITPPDQPPKKWIDIFSPPLDLKNHKVKKIDSGYGMFIQ